MKIINQNIKFIDEIDGEAVLAKIEYCGRICYKSEDKITPVSARKFVEMLLKSGHESVIEHVSVTVLFITNRGFTNRLFFSFTIVIVKFFATKYGTVKKPTILNLPQNLYFTGGADRGRTDDILHAIEFN